MKYLFELFLLNEVKIVVIRILIWCLVVNLDKIFVKVMWILNRNEKYNFVSLVLIKYYIFFGLERKFFEVSYVKVRK